MVLFLKASGSAAKGNKKEKETEKKDAAASSPPEHVSFYGSSRAQLARLCLIKATA